jgi:LL-diaminopimelate aminotransferase
MPLPENTDVRNGHEDAYLATRMQSRVAAARNKGTDLIDFGIGNPDFKPAGRFVRILQREIRKQGSHRYPIGESGGTECFRKAVAEMYARRYGVQLDPEKQVLPLIGAKEGPHYLSLALLKAGDCAIVCEPAYPVYRRSVETAGARVHIVQASEANGFLPDLKAIPISVLQKTKLFFINYPNNPMGTVASPAFFSALVQLARRYGFIVCNDNVYGEIYYDKKVPSSILEAPGALDAAVELNSTSKSYNLCGWRVGMLVGNGSIVRLVRQFKGYVDAGIFMPLQIAAASALRSGSETLERQRRKYQRRRDRLVKGLRALGYEARNPQGAMYVWMKVPNSYDSEQYSRRLLEEFGIACNPGFAYGQAGEGFVRFSLNVPEELICKALDRLRNGQHVLPNKATPESPTLIS